MAAAGQFLSGIGAFGALVVSILVYRRTSTGNGHTIGEAVAATHRMAEAAEPHHHVIPEPAD